MPYLYSYSCYVYTHYWQWVYYIIVPCTSPVHFLCCGHRSFFPSLNSDSYLSRMSAKGKPAAPPSSHLCCIDWLSRHIFTAQLIDHGCLIDCLPILFNWPSMTRENTCAYTAVTFKIVTLIVYNERFIITIAELDTKPNASFVLVYIYCTFWLVLKFQFEMLYFVAGCTFLNTHFYPKIAKA